jgi:hypothetical protein
LFCAIAEERHDLTNQPINNGFKIYHLDKTPCRVTEEAQLGGVLQHAATIKAKKYGMILFFVMHGLFRLIRAYIHEIRTIWTVIRVDREDISCEGIVQMTQGYLDNV